MLNKLQLQNVAWTSTSKSWPTLCSKSEQNLTSWPNLSFKICNKLLPTWSSLSTSATVTTSTSFELVYSHARVTSIKFTKRQSVSQWVSQWVSEWQALPMIGLGSDKKTCVQSPPVSQSHDEGDSFNWLLNKDSKEVMQQRWPQNMESLNDTFFRAYRHIASNAPLHKIMV